MFWLGVSTLAGFSLVANLFDEEFRNALGRLLLGLVVGPFFVIALLADRVLPQAGRISPVTLQRFATAATARTWSMAYRNHGVIIVRRSKTGSVRSSRSAPISVQVDGQ